MYFSICAASSSRGGCWYSFFFAIAVSPLPPVNKMEESGSGMISTYKT
jgi:hypothetical protein